MADLIVTPNLDDPDAFYAALLAAHDGLEADAVHALNARLILILANHLGDAEALGQALDLARRTAPAAEG
ncbi:DUF2783 domain-containing protein [uncultured Jannaschia sp.]|uniref:DUF2783 domain-containing protein n=1 Tax=uncultured Jannaschia sp. TaxID=293347 RepID=UPI002637BA85|nr:DUF2783 domain-containing protein [uncultured Jannaschia sp.]